MKHYGHGKGWRRKGKHILRANDAPDYDNKEVYNAKLREIRVNRQDHTNWLLEELLRFQPDGEQTQPNLFSSKEDLERREKEYHYLGAQEHQIYFHASHLANEFGKRIEDEETHQIVTPFINEPVKKQAYIAKSQEFLEGLDIGLLGFYNDRNDPSMPLSEIAIILYQGIPVFQVSEDIGVTTFPPGEIVFQKEESKKEWEKVLDDVWNKYLMMCP